MMFLRPRKLFLFFGGLYMRIHTITTQKIYLYYIMWPSGFDYLYYNNYFFNVITLDPDGKNVRRVMNFCEGREYILVMLVPWLIFTTDLL